MNDALRFIFAGLGALLVVGGISMVALRARVGKNLAIAGAVSQRGRPASLAAMMGSAQIFLGLALIALGLAPSSMIRGGTAASVSLSAVFARAIPVLGGVLAAIVVLGCAAGCLIARRAWRTRETWPVDDTSAVQIPTRARRDLTLAIVMFAVAVASAVFLALLIVPVSG